MSRPTGLESGRVTIGITTFNRPDFCVDQLREPGAGPADPGDPRRGDRRGPGHPEGRRQPTSTTEATAALGDQAAGHRAAQPRWVGRLLPRHVRDRVSEVTPTTSCCSTTTSSASSRASCGRSPSPTWRSDRRWSAARCSASTTARSCTPTARRIAKWTWFWGPAPATDARPRLRAPPAAVDDLAAPAHRRRLQRLVDVPDPHRGHPRDRPVAADVHQVGRRRVRAAGRRGRLPDGDPAGGRPSGTSRGPRRTTRSTGRRTSTSATASSPALLHSPYDHGGRLVLESLRTTPSAWSRCSTAPARSS